MSVITEEGIIALMRGAGKVAESLNLENEKNKSALGSTSEEITAVEEGVVQIYEESMQNTSDIDIILQAVAELYEMIGGKENG